MSEQARQVFDLEEQKAKDVLAAIKTIVPVISLIREWGKVEKELESAKKEKTRLTKEIASIGKTLGVLSGTAIIDDLAEERNKRCRMCAEVKEKGEELQRKYDEYEQQVISYQNYASLFGGRHVFARQRVLEQNSFEGKDELLAMLFFLYNKEDGFGFQERFQVESRFRDRLPRAFLDDWNSMLAVLKANEA